MHPKNKPVQELTDSQKLFILKQFNSGMKIRDIYKRMIGDDDRVRDGCEKFIGNERSFRYIANKQALKGIIKKVIRKLSLKTDEDKINFVMSLIESADSKPETKLKAFDMFRELQHDMGISSSKDATEVKKIMKMAESMTLLQYADAFLMIAQDENSPEIWLYILQNCFNHFNFEALLNLLQSDIKLNSQHREFFIEKFQLS